MPVYHLTAPRQSEPPFGGVGISAEQAQRLSATRLGGMFTVTCHPLGPPKVAGPLYIAREKLSWNPEKPGWGIFKYDPRLRLSIKGKKRRNWRLPGCFHPDEGCVLTYNKNRDNWGDPGSQTTVQVPARGQEYVCSLTADIEKWAHEVIDETTVWSPNGF